MKWKNRAMGLALAGCMALSVLPAVSFAADMGTVTQSELNYADSGTCGENLAWTLDEEGTLTISGTGAMYNWDDDNEAPWYEVRKQIKTVAIENGVTTIGERAFFICENLASVTIPNSVTSIGSGAFVECFHLTSVTIPDSVTSIGSSAFDGCFGLESVTLGSRLTDIPAGMFYQCSSLKSIVIPDSVISIGKAAFLECSQLESVTLGTHVTNIGSNAFYFCDDLKRIAIPDSVTSIGERAFFACSSLEHVTIGSHVTTIGRQAFEYCSSVNEIYFRGNAPEMEVYQYIEDDDAEGSFVNVTATAYYPEHATGWEDVIQKDYTGPNGKLTWVAYTPDSTTTPVYEVFSDVPANAWYTAHVQYVYDNGLMSGSSTTTFEPNSPLTRAMVVQILYNKEGKPEVTGTAAFSDVKPSDWYYNAVLWAKQNGVAAGSGGKFNPMQNVTREQFAQFLYNYEKTPAVSGSLDYPDANQISGWAKNAMLWANQNGIVNGKKQSNGTLLLDPKGRATRAEAAAMLKNYLSK